MRIALPLLATLAACGNADCPEGQARSSAGECIDLDLPEWNDDLLPDASVWACTMAETGTRLDFLGACADGACDGDTIEDMTATLGTPECRDFGIDQVVACDWNGGIGAHFDDLDRDEVPDAGAIADVFNIELPWDGTSEEGLALGLSMGCFVEVFGPPEDSDLTAWDSERMVPTRLQWANFSVSDDDLLDDPDGYADSILFYRAGGAE